MALSGRAKWGVAALAVLAVAAAGAAWVGSRSGGSGIAAPVAATQSGKNGAKPPEQIMWKDMTPVQQQALEPLAAEWDQIEPIRKQKWLGIVKRYTAMKPDEQMRVQERMREWVRLSPEERRQVRQNFARAQKLDPSQKSMSWESYQLLSDEQKKELAAKSAVKKQVANLPTTAQSKVKTVAPIKPVTPPANAAAAAAPVAVPAPAPAPAPAVDPNATIPNASNVAPVIPASAQPASSNVK